MTNLFLSVRLLCDIKDILLNATSSKQKKELRRVYKKTAHRSERPCFEKLFSDFSFFSD